MTASSDGAVKFWKKQDESIEFVKNYKSHTKAIKGLATSYDGVFAATVGLDKVLKIYDVTNFGELSIRLLLNFNLARKIYTCPKKFLYFK